MKNQLLVKITFFGLNILLIVCAFTVLKSCKPKTKYDKNILLADSLKGTFRDYNLPFKNRVDDLLGRLTLEEKISQLKYNAPAVERLGIPAYNWWNEALHGVARSGKATIFPQPIGMAATFDRDLIFRIADAISTEGRAKYSLSSKLGYHNQYGGLTYWSPNINIFRDPRWGRGMETWGEDPLLTATLASNFVRGLQGNHPKYLKATACAKHFAVHSGPEADRHYFNVLPSKKDLYETYLPAFETLVKEAKVEAVMCAYQSLNGEPCCGNPFLLQKLLVDDWGFKGHILSDCWAINDFHLNHKITKNQAESAALALKSGVDLNCGDAYDSLFVAYNKGLITSDQIDKSVKKLLLTRFRLGMFDPKEILPFQYDASVINSDEYIALAREAAGKSVVLMKNNGVLPLNPELKQLYVIGPMATDVDAMMGNYPGVSGNIVTILEGITEAVSPGSRLEYRKGFFMDRENLNEVGWAISEAKLADVTIVVMGINNDLEGEEGESIASPTKSDKVNLQLPENQLKYLKQIRDNDGKPLIVIMTGGSPLAIEKVYELADAVLWVWYPGEQGGNGVSDVLFGKISPSGKLPITFPKSVEQLPAYNNYSMKGRTYKYMKEEPLFPFGFGLSYTNFEYSLELSKDQISIHEKQDSIYCKVSIKNVGKVNSEQVIQLYIAPKDKSSDLPLFNLLDFKRLFIKANEKKSFTFSLPLTALAYVDVKGERKLKLGDYTIFASSSLPTKRSVDLGEPKPAKKSFRIY